MCIIFLVGNTYKIRLMHSFVMSRSDIPSRISYHCARFRWVCWPQMHAVFLDRILYVKLTPVCNPNSEIGAESSQRQRFKGQNQQQEALLVKKMLTGTLWWETAGVFVESSEAPLSCRLLTVCVKILSWCFILCVSAWLFSAGCMSLSLSTVFSLVSWVNVCWPHSSLATCQVEWI